MRFAALPFVALALSCASNPSAPGPDAGAEAATIGCLTDPRAQSYSSGLTITGKHGVFVVELVGAQPGPPLRGTNTWTVRVHDAKGNAVPSAALAVKLIMPDHGHGSTVAPTIAAQPDGTIKIDSLYFFMPGLWQVTLDVTAGADADSVVFSFCVAG